MGRLSAVGERSDCFMMLWSHFALHSFAVEVTVFAVQEPCRRHCLLGAHNKTLFSWSGERDIHFALFALILALLCPDFAVLEICGLSIRFLHCFVPTSRRRIGEAFRSLHCNALSRPRGAGVVRPGVCLALLSWSFVFSQSFADAALLLRNPDLSQTQFETATTQVVQQSLVQTLPFHHGSSW